jgi:hypothetical protein
LLLAAPADAQQVRSWSPPDLDSLRAWTKEAKRLFRANTGDSATGANFQAYNLVGRSGRKLLRSLGRPNLIQAPAVKTVLDSLGLATDVRVDAVLPEFVLLVARNPYRRSAQAVGFLYWYKDADLRMQPVTFLGGGRAADARVVGRRRIGAVLMAVVDRSRGEMRHHLTVLSLTPGGDYWRITQFDPNGLRPRRRSERCVRRHQRRSASRGDAWVPAVLDSMVQELSPTALRVR